MEYSSIKLTKIYDMQEELEFKKAYLKIVEFLNTWIHGSYMKGVFDFVRDNQLSKKNNRSVGKFILKAIDNYPIKEHHLTREEKLDFQEWVQINGLMEIIKEEILNHAQELLKLKKLEYDLKKLPLNSNRGSLYYSKEDLQNAKKLLNEFADKMNFKEMEKEAEEAEFKADFLQVFAFKTLMETAKRQEWAM
ncbi:hypothetical protein ACOZNZ_001519 [Campylobacter upsaliensis]